MILSAEGLLGNSLRVHIDPIQQAVHAWLVDPKLGNEHRPPGTAADLLAEGFRALHETGELAAARECFTAAAYAADDPTSLGFAALGLSGLWVQERRSSVASAQARAWRELALQRLDPASTLANRLKMRAIA